jgi:uncharacterized phosphosugar-binding protein/6-phosphogluconolactonase/glucosamine-6-phosphate isomerase/deaminase
MTSAPFSPVVRKALSRALTGQQAASDVARAVRTCLGTQARARMIFAAAPSQRDMLEALIAEPGNDWSRVEAFHMDEYLGLPPDAPQRFGNWLQDKLFSHLPFGAVHLILPDGDPSATAETYAALLAEAPIDIVCLGIGINGHLAFNDPPVADLQDPLPVKIVELEETCRRQQVDDGCFPTIDSVPTHAITLTVPRLLDAGQLFCVVPGQQKREAVRRALYDPIGTACPATALRLHPACTLYLDPASNPMPDNSGTELCAAYLDATQALMRRILEEEQDNLGQAARRVADQIARDGLVHIFGPGGHSNLAAQEIFYRAGGLMHIAPILDEGTLLSSGALRSTAMERTPGYGRVVIADRNLGTDDVLILVNTYGINVAMIDAALEAKRRGVYLIGLNSRAHAAATPPDHPARHPDGLNLHDLVDVAIDTKVPVGDAVMAVPGVAERVASVSTFVNAFALNCLVLRTVALLATQGVEPPLWRSGNAAGGDEANARLLSRFRQRVRGL